MERHVPTLKGMERFRLATLIVCGSLLASSAAAQSGAVDGEWRATAAANGNTKYSSLDQIRPQNVGRLQIAWARPTVVLSR